MQHNIRVRKVFVLNVTARRVDRLNLTGTNLLYLIAFAYRRYTCIPHQIRTVSCVHHKRGSLAFASRRICCWGFGSLVQLAFIFANIIAFVEMLSQRSWLLCSLDVSINYAHNVIFTEQMMNELWCPIWRVKLCEQIKHWDRLGDTATWLFSSTSRPVRVGPGYLEDAVAEGEVRFCFQPELCS